MNTMLWRPTPLMIAKSNMTAFMRAVGREWDLNISDYPTLYRWSLEEPEKFWRSVWSFCGVIAQHQGNVTIQDRTRMPGARWFPEARLNFAQNLMRRRDNGIAIIFRGENRVESTVTFAELHHEVSRMAQALRALGVMPGDRVAANMPNIPGAVIAMLATTSIGAVWSSCSPDFGVQGVLDRFSQIEPKVLIAADGYFYAGKTIDVTERIRAVARALPSVRKVVVVPYTRATPRLTGIPNAVNVHDFMGRYRARPMVFESLPFNHPVFILYSSGTTGVPKCIVHGAGGTLLQHMKEHQLHVDLQPGDRMFYFTTCGWMVWNWLVSGLASGATIMLYDGSPFHPSPNVLFDFAATGRMTVMGTSAKFIDAIAKVGIEPARTHRLDSLATILSTGSPLAPEGFDYVYRKVKPTVRLSSIAGGTDLISCFAIGNPILPVWRGEIQCRALGMKVEVFDEDGRSVRAEKGELVCTAPFPSMPVGFWNDPGNVKYHAAYFEKFPGVWCHGDYVELTAHDGMVFYGRSDAVLNPGGVRIGTAEIYRQVEQLHEVVESLVIGQAWENDVRVVLFVRLREELTLDDALTAKIRHHIRASTTPRHVPARVVQVSDIPRTKSGKIVELAVRNVVHGQPVRNLEALANPEALELFRNRKELAS